jgi:hypothetical protein
VPSPGPKENVSPAVWQRVLLVPVPVPVPVPVVLPGSVVAAALSAGAEPAAEAVGVDTGAADWSLALLPLSFPPQAVSVRASADVAVKAAAA